MSSQKQAAILAFLHKYPHPYSPTVREIGEAVGLRSSSTVHSYLIKLENQGLIERKLGCPRCIAIKNHPVKHMEDECNG